MQRWCWESLISNTSWARLIVNHCDTKLNLSAWQPFSMIKDAQAEYPRFPLEITIKEDSKWGMSWACKCHPCSRGIITIKVPAQSCNVNKWYYTAWEFIWFWTMKGLPMLMSGIRSSSNLWLSVTSSTLLKIKMSSLTGFMSTFRKESY